MPCPCGQGGNLLGCHHIIPFDSCLIPGFCSVSTLPFVLPGSSPWSTRSGECIPFDSCLIPGFCSVSSLPFVLPGSSPWSTRSRECIPFDSCLIPGLCSVSSLPFVLPGSSPWSTRSGECIPFDSGTCSTRPDCLVRRCLENLSKKLPDDQGH